MLAGAGFVAQGAQATDLTRTTVLSLTTDGSNGFNGHFNNDTFGAGTKGKTFEDTYTFTIGSGFDSSASLTSTFIGATKDLVITGFSLNKYSGALSNVTSTVFGINEGVSIDPVTHLPLPKVKDSWSLDGASLSMGTYFLQVNGKVLGVQGGSYGGDVTISAVPEAETYAMLLAGLGLVGFVARRKAAKKAA